MADPSGNPIPAALDGLRVPARFVRQATIGAQQDGSLAVTGFEPWPPSAMPAGAFTAVICDGGVHHYYHFAEALIWLLALQDAYLPACRLARIVFAWPWDNPAQNHVQREVLAAVCPGVPVLDAGAAWPATFGDVLVIDRSWHETTLHKFLQAALGIAPPAVRRMGQLARRSVGAGESRHPGGPHILYAARPPPRCLTAPAEAELLALLGRFGPVTACDFAAVPWAQQVRLCAAHDVLAGVHGNALTNALWLRPGSLVLEMFPDGVRHYDYQILAELAGHAYFGFERDRVFPAFSRTGAPYGHQAPTQQPVTRIPSVELTRILAAYAAPGHAAG